MVCTFVLVFSSNLYEYYSCPKRAGHLTLFNQFRRWKHLTHCKHFSFLVVMLHVYIADMLGLSFQLASLEENAAIYLWVTFLSINLLSYFLRYMICNCKILKSFNVNVCVLDRLLLNLTKPTMRAQSRISVRGKLSLIICV